MQLRRVVWLVLAVTLGFGSIMWFVARTDVPTVSGAFDAGRGRLIGTIATAAYGFGVTLLGVALGASYRRLAKMRDQGIEHVALFAAIGDISTSVDFLIGLVGSPIVFGLLWQTISDISLAGITVIALQNGFASHALVDQISSGTRPKSIPSG